jgi:hypothetical protein
MAEETLTAPAPETTAPEAGTPTPPSPSVGASAPTAAATPPPPAGGSTPPPTTSASTETTPSTTDANASTQVSADTQEALDIDRFVQYLKKQESALGKLKKAMLAVNLSLKDTEPEDKINFFKMLRGVANKQLGNIDTKK